MTTRKRRSAQWALIAVAIVAAACSGAGDQSDVSASETTMPASAAMPTGDPAPTTEFVRFDGTSATFADYADRPLVVNFWASWCPSCIAELSAAFRPAQEQLGDEVAFLGVNIQDERNKALELIDEAMVRFDLAEDPRGDLYLELGGLGMPFTVFITEDGRVADRHNGPLTEEQLLDKIDQVLLG